MQEKTIFSTPWFQLIEKQKPGTSDLYYSIRASDYVHVVALTPERDFILVRQFRPAVGRLTLELPGGHVDPGQTPEEAARMELREETGCTAAKWTLLGTAASDTGRLENSLWCYLAEGVTGYKDEPYTQEEGIEVVRQKGGLSALLANKDFCSALNYSSLLWAVQHGALTFNKEASLS